VVPRQQACSASRWRDSHPVIGQTEATTDKQPAKPGLHHLWMTSLPLSTADGDAPRRRSTHMTEPPSSGFVMSATAPGNLAVRH
jgi:hypothetical protein